SEQPDLDPFDHWSSLPVSRKHRTNSGLRRQRGVGMIEVMVAVLVLAIGLLGLAGLQIRSLKDNQSAGERGLAVVETHSIIDARRADRQNAVNGEFNIDFADDNPTGTTFHEVAIIAWRSSLTAMLGSAAKGKIDCNGPDCTITVQWDDSRATAGSQTFS